MFCDLVLSQFVKSWKSFLSFSYNLIGFFKETLKSDWLLCFNKAFSFGKKKGVTKGKKWCDS